MKYKVYESEEGLESLGKIHPVKITKYGNGFTIEQNISSDELNKRKWDDITAKDYRKNQSLIMRHMFNVRSAKEKRIKYEPKNVENFNENHKSAKELFAQDQVEYFDNEGLL